MILDLAALIAAGIAPTQARLFVEPLRKACARFEIDTPARLAAFIGQGAVESRRFTQLEEGLFYTSAERVREVFPTSVPSLAEAAKLTRNPRALANRVYANRLGNGDEASGDGWLFRGRGIYQLTGRENYADAAESLGLPLLTTPGLVAEPDGACLTGAWFWHSRKLNILADAFLIDEITRAVNGRAMLHADLRRQITEAAARAFA